jgi:hypothetical protein
MRPFGYFADAHSPAPSRKRGDNSLPRLVAYCGEEFFTRGELLFQNLGVYDRLFVPFV